MYGVKVLLINFNRGRFIKNYSSVVVGVATVFVPPHCAAV